MHKRLRKTGSNPKSNHSQVSRLGNSTIVGITVIPHDHRYGYADHDRAELEASKVESKPKSPTDLLLDCGPLTIELGNLEGEIGINQIGCVLEK